MYQIIEWNEKLDLSLFYKEAKARGFVNNSTQKQMIDCFHNERKWNAWILFQNDQPIGSVVAHTFDEMGPCAFRVLARTCTFGSARPNTGLVTCHRLIAEHQNLTDQFLLPKCIEWANSDNLYATSNQSPFASQRLVHKHYFPTFEKIGLAKKIKEIKYRNTEQTVWQIFPEKFLSNLNKYPRWV